MLRSPKEERVYSPDRESVRKDNMCVFCVIRDGRDVFYESKHFRIIRNIYPYSFWDYQGVTDHLMVVPIKHTDTLAALTPAESTEFVQLLAEYESKGYNVYARAPNSRIKSIEHQHTHLIKTDNKFKKFILYIKKPHLRFMR